MSTDYQLKLQTWSISHPYALLSLFFIFVIVMYIIFLPKLFRKMSEPGPGKRWFRNMLLYFCIVNAMAIVSLLISYFRGK
jgi:hypothetical protein